MTGLDFSYIPGKPHAREAYSHILHLCDHWRLNPSPLLSAGLRRPLIRVTGKGGSTVATDSVLMSYAGHARELGKENDRIYDAGKEGLSIVTVTSDDTDELKRIIRQAAENGTTVSNESNAENDEISRDRRRTDIADFMRNECVLLDRLIDGIGRLNDEADTELSGSLKALLRQLDYIYIDFPDKPPLPAENRAFLSRTLNAAAYYRQVISHSLQTLQ